MVFKGTSAQLRDYLNSLAAQHGNITLKELEAKTGGSQ